MIRHKFRLIILSTLLFLSSLSGLLFAQNLSYPIVGTNQTHCYNETNVAIACPAKGEALYGQDAQYSHNMPHYVDNGDGTITDKVTGLMWQKNLNAKVSDDEAEAGAKKFKLAGYSDWRLPTIKELYSLIEYSGTSGSPPPMLNSSSGSQRPNGRDKTGPISGGIDMSHTPSDAIPYIDTNYFGFAYGNTNAGERYIDVQEWSSTRYLGITMGENPTAFGVNFADGRIKGYPITVRRPDGKSQTYTLFARYVRGNPEYGSNKFKNNKDGTILDQATGLIWMQKDSGFLKAGDKQDGKLNWPQALAWCTTLKYAGHTDWRLPNAKELQSIVDYARSPPVTHSAAIDPIFQISEIQDDEGKQDWPFFWTSTTHLDGPQGKGVGFAVYIAFGTAQGYMSVPPGSSQKRLLDVHGAGAQRSSPKVGNDSDYPKGQGPQGDVIRVYNFARCVRGQS